MSEISKVLTTLTPKLSQNTTSATARNHFPSVKGDKEVLLNKEGYLDTSLPAIISPCTTVQIDNAAAANAASGDLILHGDYFNTSQTVENSVISPAHLIIYNTTGAGADSVQTLPSPGEHIGWLRNYCPAMCKAGLSYEIVFINQNATFNLSFEVPSAPAGESVQRVGFNNNQQHDIAPKSSARLRFLIFDVTSGSENINYFVY